METQIRKKKVLILSDHPCALTGFGKHCKNILEYLYNTGKYELINLAVGTVNNNQVELNRTPWKTIGTIVPEKIQNIQSQNDPKNWDNIGRMCGYGAFSIDEVVRSEKPDILFAIQDIWGIDFCLEHPWFNKITSVMWTTLDSLPILEKGLAAAKKSKIFWSWANFATKAMHKVGLTHVKTVPGCMNIQHFHKIPVSQRTSLRMKFNISPDTFVAGFVFRNQLRKSVPNLLQGFQTFKKDNPKIKAKLLLHTHWNEGWNIVKLMQEFNINPSDVLTTYACRACNQYEIKPFTSHEDNCKFCNAQKSQVTTGPGFGVHEKQLNEIYNIMDVYIHPFTSGGLEIPCYEAKLTELVTLVTNYSCGEDLCVPEAGSFPLDWAEYREPDTMFIKASTYPSSIAKQLQKILNMNPETRAEIGKKARQWVIDNYSVEKIGKILEDTIDAAPFIDDPSMFEKPKKNSNPYYSMPEIPDDGQWILHMYEKILDEPEPTNGQGYLHWMSRINKDLTRPQIEQYFRQVAYKTLQEQQGGTKFEDLLDKEDKGRIILVNPEGPDSVFLSTSLFQSIKDKYPEFSFYVSTKREFKELVEGNPLVYKWIEFNPMLNNLLFLEGNSQHNGYFQLAYIINTEQNPNWTHNAIDKIDFDLKKSGFIPTLI